MELKDNNDMGKMLFIYLVFSSKGPIELYAVVGRSPQEIFVLLCKKSKIILMHGLMAAMRSIEIVVIVVVATSIGFLHVLLLN